MESNPYLEARREWDERYADLVLGKRNWQIAAAGSIAVSFILAFGIVWLSTRSRFVPYVVQVDKLGFALAAPQALSSESPSQLTDERMVRYELAGFIRSTRESDGCQANLGCGSRSCRTKHLAVGPDAGGAPHPQ